MSLRIKELTNDRSYNHISTSVAAAIKSGPGILQSLALNNVGTSWQIDVYDGTGTTGARIASIRSGVYGVMRYDLTFNQGLFIDAVEGTAGSLTVIYK